MSAATLDITIDRAADWSKVITVTDSGGNPVVLTPAVAGVRQVNTATTVGTVSGSGYLAVIFTSALTGSVSKRVAVVAGDTPTVINAKICQEFNTDPRFAAHFRASYSTSSLIATAHAAAANDSTVNWDLGGAGTDAAGVTPDATSTNTTAGVAQVFGAASFKGQLSVRPGGPPVAEFRFEIIAGGDENQVRVVLPRFQTAKLSSEQVYHFDWFAYTGGRFLLRHVQGTVKVRGNSTILGTSLNPATTPSGAIAATWGAIVGTLSDQTDLQAAIDAAVGGGGVTAFVDLTDAASANLPSINTPLATALSGKLSTSGTAADVNPAGTAIASALAGKASLGGNNTFTARQEFSDSATWIYTTASKANHLSSLGAGTTGAELFQAATAEAARSTLGTIRRITTADVSNSTQTPSNGNVPELTFPVVAGRTYKIDFCFILAASGGSLVHQIRATYPTATLPALGDCLSLHRFNVKTPTPGSTSMDFNTSTAGAAVLGVHSGYWFYRPSASGNVTFQIYNYDATAVTSTLKAGSIITVTEL